MKKLLVLLLSLVLVLCTTGCGYAVGYSVDKKGNTTATTYTYVYDEDLEVMCEIQNEGVEDESELVTVEDMRKQIEEGDEYEKTVRNGVECYVSKETEKIGKWKYIKYTHCSIPVSEITSVLSADEVSVKFPYKVKKCNAGGIVSDDGKTVTWDLNNLPEGTKKLTAYTTKYKKK